MTRGWPRAVHGWTWLCRLLLMAGLAGMAWPLAAAVIPAYTPNVVDPDAVLSADERSSLNRLLLQLRKEADIWGAVYIVETLSGDTIEARALAAFDQWQLGRKGQDNGLLLVIAMRERRSRLEVGYGLEGVIPDALARRVLDEVLAPYMRQGQTAAGIAAALRNLAQRAQGQTPAPSAAPAPVVNAGAARPQHTTQHTEAADGWRGWLSWGLLTAALWLTLPLSRRSTRWRREWLYRRHPELRRRPEVTIRDAVEREHQRRWWLGMSTFEWVFCGFFTVNPGVFVFIAGTYFDFVPWLILGLTAVVWSFVLNHYWTPYVSEAAYRRHVAKQTRRRRTLLQRGDVAETEPGVFRYTERHYQRVAAAAQAAGSSSSGGDSGGSSGGSGGGSSSGGGRSGGGGASSGW